MSYPQDPIDLGLGRDKDGRLICDKGFVSGPHGKQIASPSPSTVAFFDDFLGDVLDDRWNFVESAGESGTDGAGAILPAVLGTGTKSGIGGVLRLTTGNDDANGTVATCLVAVTQELQWQAANGGLAFECRVKPSRVTNAYFFFGFTDVKTIEAPVTLSTATYTPNATNAVGFLFDTNATVVGWNLVGVAAGTEATHQALGTSYAPVADDFATYRIEVNSAGAAVFYINGLQVGTTLSGAVSPGVLTNGAVSNVPLTPIVAASSVDTAAAILVDIDYIHVSMNRAPDGDMT